MTQIPPPYSASFPFMVTQAMKRRLRTLGRSDEDIANLTPQQAHHVLSYEWCAEITIFETGDGILSKVIRLGDGKVHCDGSACKMWEGTAWRVPVTSLTDAPPSKQSRLGVCGRICRSA